MNQFKRNYRNEVMKKKREERKKIKEQFVDTGRADHLMAKVREKAKPSIIPKQLPF